MVSSSQLNAATLLESPPSLEIDDCSNPSVAEIEELIVPPEHVRKPEASAAWKADDFVFGLETSALKRQKGKKVATLVVEGDELDSKPYMVALVAATLSTHAVIAVSSFAQIASHHGWVPPPAPPCRASLLSDTCRYCFPE